MLFVKYDTRDLYERILATIQGHRHQDYKRTLDHARWCFQMMTGDQQQEILVRYKRREDDEQKEQRISVTNSRTQYVSNKVFNLFSEVHRSDRTINQVSYAADDRQEDLARLEENLRTWQHNKPIEQWLDDRFRYGNFYDPNAWIVIEFTNDDPLNQAPQAYPIEVGSANVVDFEYERGCLQYLVTKYSEHVASKDDDEALIHTYTLYGPQTSWRIIEVPDNADYQIPQASGTIQVERLVKSEEEQTTLLIESYENRLPLVPATRVGYLADPHTKGRTYVSPMWPAEKIMTDLIWKKSEYDLAHALHGFYQKFIYVDDCPACEGTGHLQHPSLGTLQCGTCEGSGVNHHTTTQDVIEIMRVDDAGQHIPLSEMVHYEQIPMDLIKQQKEDLKDLERDTFNAIFGSNVLERSEVAITATEKNYDWRSVNNTLIPYAERYTEVYKFLVTSTAEIRQVGEGLMIEYAFPSSFNLESITDLIAQRQAAMTAGAPWNVTFSIDLNIIQKQHKDNPAYVQRYRAIEEMRPFNDKQLAERQYIISLLPQDDPQTVLYLYFDQIMAEILDAVPDFALFSYQERRRLVDAAVLIKQRQLIEGRPTLFGTPADPGPEPTPGEA